MNRSEPRCWMCSPRLAGAQMRQRHLEELVDFRAVRVKFHRISHRRHPGSYQKVRAKE